MLPAGAAAEESYSGYSYSHAGRQSRGGRPTTTSHLGSSAGTRGGGGAPVDRPAYVRHLELQLERAVEALAEARRSEAPGADEVKRLQSALRQADSKAAKTLDLVKMTQSYAEAHAEAAVQGMGALEARLAALEAAAAQPAGISRVDGALSALGEQQANLRAGLQELQGLVRQLQSEAQRHAYGGSSAARSRDSSPDRAERSARRMAGLEAALGELQGEVAQLAAATSRGSLQAPAAPSPVSSAGSPAQPRLRRRPRAPASPPASPPRRRAADQRPQAGDGGGRRLRGVISPPPVRPLGAAASESQPGRRSPSPRRGKARGSGSQRRSATENTAPVATGSGRARPQEQPIHVLGVETLQRQQAATATQAFAVDASWASSEGGSEATLACRGSRSVSDAHNRPPTGNAAEPSWVAADPPWRSAADAGGTFPFTPSPHEPLARADGRHTAPVATEAALQETWHLPLSNPTHQQGMPSPPLQELQAALSANGGQLERLGHMMEEMLTQVRTAKKAPRSAATPAAARPPRSAGPSLSTAAPAPRAKSTPRSAGIPPRGIACGYPVTSTQADGPEWWSDCHAARPRRPSGGAAKKAATRSRSPSPAAGYRPGAGADRSAAPWARGEKTKDNAGARERERERARSTGSAARRRPAGVTAEPPPARRAAGGAAPAGTAVGSATERAEQRRERLKALYAELKALEE
eukprot:jgi/Tetstr1/431221/TSEL_020933.t1